MAYVEISLVEALDIINNDGCIYIKLFSDYEYKYVSIDGSNTLNDFLESVNYYKEIKATINGKTFDNKAEALNEINKIFGE